MNLSDKETIELTGLMSAAVDGRLTETERLRLEDWLRESEAARRFYVRFMGLSADLSMVAAETLAERTDTSSQRDASSSADLNRTDRMSGGPGLIDWLRGRWRWIIAVGAAACVVAGTIGSFMGTRPLADPDEDGEAVEGPNNAVAMLTRSAGAVWADAADAPDIGSSLEPGWLRLKSGVAQVEFFNGARVILEGPAEFELVSGDEGRLRFGKLNAHVPPPARGFKVHTARMVVVDLGTEFALNEQPERSSEVHVFTGKVQLEFGSTNHPLRELVAGEGARVESPGEINAMPANAKEFVSAEELQAREAAELRARFEEWKVLDEKFAADPALLVYFNFEGDDRGALINRALSARKATDGTIVGCERAEGRWPGKAALRFVNRGDRVKLKVPGTFESLTYSAWVSIDNLSRPNNALAMSQRFKRGDVRWEITSPGALRLTVNTGETNRAVTGPRSLKSQFGRWVHLVAVYDGPGRQVSLYINGNCVVSRSISDPVPLILEDVELGNWSPLLNPPDTSKERRDRQRPSFNVRNFHGRMDEFALLSRALSSEEIRALYESGKPRTDIVLAKSP